MQTEAAKVKGLLLTQKKSLLKVAKNQLLKMLKKKLYIRLSNVFAKYRFEKATYRKAIMPKTYMVITASYLLKLRTSRKKKETIFKSTNLK